MLAMSDQLLEDVFDFVNSQSGEQNRTAVARAAKLAAEYRSLQLKRQAMQRANERRVAERAALRASTAAERGQRTHTLDGAVACLPAAPVEGETA